MNPSDAPGCHMCGGSPMFQWMRRVTAAEAAQQKAGISLLQGRFLTDAEVADRYGLLVTSVTGCGQHHLGDVPGNADSGIERRALIHDADCGGHGRCTCKGVGQSHAPNTAHP